MNKKMKIFFTFALMVMFFSPELFSKSSSKELESQYADKLASLQKEIIAALPLDSEKVAAYQQAVVSEEKARAELDLAKKDLGQIATAKALVEHAKKKWIGGAEKEIAKLQEILKKSPSDEGRRTLEKVLANKEEGIKALKERQAVLEKLLAEEPVLNRNLELAEQKLAEARNNTQEALSQIGKGQFIPPEKLKAFLNAFKQEKKLEQALADAKAEMGKIGRARGLVGHAKNKWIGGAEKAIAKTRTKLKKATTDDERKVLQEDLEKYLKNKQEGLDALKERQAKLDKLLVNELKFKKNVETCTQELETARVATQKALGELGLEPVLKSDALDEKLIKYVILYEATPLGLAEFASQGKEYRKLVDQLMAYKKLMKQMLMADGAKAGKYGQAIKIYSDIQKASKEKMTGILQRLALAVSLEHADPKKQQNPAGAKNAPSNVDPVKRYLSYEKAYLAGDLDPAFKDLDVWELRMVIYGSEPDYVNTWGREMLRSYRPDHIANPDYNWRYVAAVRTDVPYRNGYGKEDIPENQLYQNILMNGGVCGRRAFFGRFMLRSFGIPTTARPQPGHAALAHWTPKGWILCFGAGWGAGWTKTRYKKDLDFLATTQVRENMDAYMMVKRAQWIGDVFGEDRVLGLYSGNPGFWYGASLYKQRDIIDQIKAKALAAVGEELGEANESNVKYKDVKTQVTDADRKISIDPESGVITIPAVACTEPKKSTKKILFMPSNLGGKQLHYNRVGKLENFDYEVDVPKAGKYKLTARVITPTPNQYLRITLNGDSFDITDIELPYTKGLWGKTEPVRISLVKGKNTFQFSRSSYSGGKNDIRGLTIKDFQLTPVK